MATCGRDESRGMNSIPRNGSTVPNRVFVGGISSCTTEDDLRNLFSKLGNVKGSKVVFDSAGIPKGYGFVTFETDQEAQAVIKAFKVERLIFRDRKLNVAPAVKKQPYNRTTESNSVQNTSIVWPAQPFSKTTSVISREPVYYPQASWPLVWPQFYYDQQYHYPSMPHAGFPQYVYPIAAAEYPYQSVSQVASSDYLETSSVDSGESIKNRPKPAASTFSSDYDRPIPAYQSDAQNMNVQRFNNGSFESPASFQHTVPFSHLHPVFAKTINGVTVMTYPSSVFMGNQALLHVKDGNTESDNAMTEFGFLHSSIAPGTLTPPPTPIV